MIGKMNFYGMPVLFSGWKGIGQDLSIHRHSPDNDVVFTVFHIGPFTLIERLSGANDHKKLRKTYGQPLLHDGNFAGRRKIILLKIRFFQTICSTGFLPNN